MENKKPCYICDVSGLDETFVSESLCNSPCQDYFKWESNKNEYNTKRDIKLIDYVINNDKEIENIKQLAKNYETELEKFIKTTICPFYFDYLKDTKFDKAYVLYEDDGYHKYDCKYKRERNQEKCNECWDREILVESK